MHPADGVELLSALSRGQAGRSGITQIFAMRAALRTAGALCAEVQDEPVSSCYRACDVSEI